MTDARFEIHLQDHSEIDFLAKELRSTSGVEVERALAAIPIDNNVLIVQLAVAAISAFAKTLEEFAKAQPGASLEIRTADGKRFSVGGLSAEDISHHVRALMELPGDPMVDPPRPKTKLF